MFKFFSDNNYFTSSTISYFKDYYEFGKTHDLDTVSVSINDLESLMEVLLTDKELKKFKDVIQESRINYLYKHLPIDQNKKGGEQE